MEGLLPSDTTQSASLPQSGGSPASDTTSVHHQWYLGLQAATSLATVLHHVGIRRDTSGHVPCPGTTLTRTSLPATHCPVSCRPYPAAHVLPHTGLTSEPARPLLLLSQGCTGTHFNNSTLTHILDMSPSYPRYESTLNQ